MYITLRSGSSYWKIFSQEDQSSSEYHSADSQSTEYQSAEEQSAEEQSAEEPSAEDPSIVSSDVKWLEENGQFNNNWALVV